MSLRKSICFLIISCFLYEGNTWAGPQIPSTLENKPRIAPKRPSVKPRHLKVPQRNVRRPHIGRPFPRPFLRRATPFVRRPLPRKAFAPLKRIPPTLGFRRPLRRPIMRINPSHRAPPAARLMIERHSPGLVRRAGVIRPPSRPLIVPSFQHFKGTQSLKEQSHISATAVAPAIIEFSKPPATPSTQVPAKKRPIRILSLDGGGVRGLGTAVNLRNIQTAIQERLGRLVPLFDMFDVFAGTSTGGLIALMLTTDHSIEDCIQLYQTRAPQIFSTTLSHRFRTLFGVNGPKYDTSTGLGPLLTQNFGETLLRDARKPVLVTAYEPTQSRLHLLDSERAKTPEAMFHSLKVKKAARATSAAPTYFAATTIECRTPANRAQRITVIDGGVAANNPAHLAFARARELYPDRDYIVISVGTGHQHAAPTDRRAGLLQFAPGAIGHLMAGTSAATHRALRTSLRDHYHRLQFKSVLGLDTTDPIQLQGLVAAADALKTTPAFQRTVNCLSSALLLPSN